MNRRNFLRKLGIGVGVAVVAPTMVIPKPTSSGLDNFIVAKARRKGFTGIPMYEECGMFPDLRLAKAIAKLYSRDTEFPLLTLTKGIKTYGTGGEYEWNINK